MSTAKKAVEPSGVPANDDAKVITLPQADKTPAVKTEERLEKLEDFLKLRDTHDRLRQKQKALQALTSKEDNTTSCKIEITGSGNDCLEITNSTVVLEVLKVATKTLDEAVAIAQNNVLTFEI